MSKLIVSLDGAVLREYKIESERVRIGRKPHNDIQIDNLAVSGEHAAITTIQQDSFLEDLNSTNGTIVNGKPVQKHFLQDGDLIELGKYRVKYVREGAPRAAPEDFEKTMLIRPGAKPTGPTPAPATSAAVTAPALVSPPAAPLHPASAAVTTTGEPAAKDRVGVIQVLNGANAGKSLDLIKNLTSVGKPGVQVAIITKRPTGFFITHVEGPSRPMVNGVQIGVQAHELKPRDIIELAGIKMEFFYK